MSQQDPLANFLGDLAEKIKVTKEHKDIMEAVYASASATEVVKEQDDPFAGFLQKVGKALSEKIPIKENIEKPKETPPLVVEIAKPIEKIPEPEPKENEPVKSLAYKIKEAIEKAKNRALNGVPVPAQENNEEKPKVNEPEDEQIATYISELEKIKDTGTVQQKEEAITSLKELKEYVDKTVKDYSRRILDLGSGGGTVAVQYANGGTMNGDLNINGHILSGGRNISDYFGTGGGGGGTDLGDIPILSGNWNNTYNIVSEGSARWESTYYNTSTLSASWNSSYYTLRSLSSTWISTYSTVSGLSSDWRSVYATVQSLSDSWEESAIIAPLQSASGSWNSSYTTTNLNSASWASVYNTYNTLSASYATETLAIAYAVAL